MALELPTLLQQVRFDASGASKGAAEAEAGGKKIQGSFGGIKKVAAGLGAALGGLAIGEFFKGAIEEGEKAERQQRLIAQAIENTHGAAHVTEASIASYATKLSELDGVSKLNIESSDQLLLRFTNIRNEQGKNNDVFTRATATIQDIVAATGKGLTPVTVALGKALNDPVKGMTALTRIGIQFTAQQQAQVKQMVKSNNTLGAQKLILDAIQTRFGGAAAAAATPLAKLHATFQNLEEGVGGALIPLLDEVVKDITPVLHGVEGLIGGFDKIPGPVRTAAVSLALLTAAGFGIGKLVGIAKDAASGIAGTVGKIVGALSGEAAAEEGSAAATTESNAVKVASYSTLGVAAQTTAKVVDEAEAEMEAASLASPITAAVAALAIGAAAFIKFATSGDDSAKVAKKLAANLAQGGDAAAHAAVQVAAYEKAAATKPAGGNGAFSDEQRFNGTAEAAGHAQAVLTALSKAQKDWNKNAQTGQGVNTNAAAAQQIYSDAVARYGENSKQARNAQGLYQSALTKQQGVDQAVQKTQDAVTASLAGQGKAAASTADQLKTLDDQVKALTDQYNLLFGRNVDLVQSNLDVQKGFEEVGKNLTAQGVALLGYVKAVHDHGAASKEATDAQTALADAVNTADGATIQMIGTLEKHREAQVKAGVATGTANNQFALQTVALFSTAKQAGATTTEITDLLTAMGLTPKQIQTIISAPGGAQTQLLLDDILGKLGIAKQGARIPIVLEDQASAQELLWWQGQIRTMEQSGIALPVNIAQRRPHAHGVFATQAENALIGEAGPEVVLPLTSAPDMRRVLAEAGPRNAAAVAAAAYAASGTTAAARVGEPGPARTPGPQHVQVQAATTNEGPFVINVYATKVDEAQLRQYERRRRALAPRRTRGQ